MDSEKEKFLFLPSLSIVCISLLVYPMKTSTLNVKSLVFLVHLRSPLLLVSTFFKFFVINKKDIVSCMVCVVKNSWNTKHRSCTWTMDNETQTTATVVIPHPVVANLIDTITQPHLFIKDDTVDIKCMLFIIQTAHRQLLLVVIHKHNSQAATLAVHPLVSKLLHTK